MRPHTAIGILLAATLIGCSSPRQRVVGTWKGEIASKSSSEDKSDDKDKSSANDFGKALSEGVKSFVSTMIGPLTYEFNDKGRYKLTMRVGSQEGSYTVNGNEVKADSDDGKSHATFILSDDGQSMSSKKDFKSDSDDAFVLKKQPE